MAWKLNNEGAKEVGSMKQAEKTQLNNWMHAVSTGAHPKTEADKWDSDYEVLHSKTSTVDDKKGVSIKCCSIRLTQSNRVYFVQVDSAQYVKVLKYGDHSEPTWP